MTFRINLSFKTIYSVLLGMLPVLMVYRFPFTDMGISTVLLGISCVWIIINYIGTKPKLINGAVFILFLFILYKLFRSFSFISEEIAIIITAIHVFGFIKGSVDTKSMIRTIEIVSVCSALFVIFQLICHYLIGLNVPGAIESFVTSDIKEQYHNAILNATDPSGAYRPSAFFMEPSHYAAYNIIGLCGSLFFDKVNIKKAIIITAGILGTTSGIGMMLFVLVWTWYVLTIRKNEAVKKNYRKPIIYILAILIISIIALQIPMVQYALARIFGSFGKVDSSYNAVLGRTFWWKSYIGELSGISLIFGKGFSVIPGAYFTGLMSLLYYYGVVGAVLYFFVLTIIALKSKGLIRCLAFVSIAMTISSDNQGFIIIIFNLSLLLSSSIFETVELKETSNIQGLRSYRL